MKVSLQWVRKFTDVDLPTDELVEKIGAQLGAVEEAINLGERYRGIVIAKVISVEKHPDADKLSVCMIDDGGAVKDASRDKNGLVQVVCGAPNVAAGQLVAWLPPGSIVPNTYNKDRFVLEARELRGKMSNGMIASARELALGDEHEGILVIDKPAKPGESFAEVYELDDYIIDIENKMFTHRPDLFGQLGVAREIAGIRHKTFKSPGWYKKDPDTYTDGRKNVVQLKVKNEEPELVPRFLAVVIKDVRVGPSPLWLQTYLARVGVRPINNIVDTTNYLMLETAQPLHAYDYDKLKTATLGIRLSKKGEELELLGGKVLKLDQGSIVITDGLKPVGLGGVMGGADTEVSSETRNIILEAATFDMNTTRKTAMRYGLFTDAATRFTKNQSPHQNMAALLRAVSIVRETAGGRQASKVVDNSRVKSAGSSVKVTARFINERLGGKLTALQIKRFLENVEFTVKIAGDELSIRPPFWRTDIEIPEDIVEEVGRLYGYDRLPHGLPSREISPTEVNPLLSFKSRLRDILAKAGGNEALTYSFIHGSLIEKAGQDKKDAYHIRNALSPDLQYYRLSLVPNLLEKIHPNVKLGFEQFALFEIGKAHIKGVLDEEKLPLELERLAAVIAGPDTKTAGAPYYMAKTYVEHLFWQGLGIGTAEYVLLEEARKLPKVWEVAAKAYEPARAAVVYAQGQLLGLVGEPSPGLRSALKLPSRTAQLELDIEVLQRLSGKVKGYHPLNKYPQTEQDICLRTDAGLTYGELTQFVMGYLEEVRKEHGYDYWLRPLDIYQREADKEHKQVTWRILLSHPARTLTTEETNKLLYGLAKEAKVKIKAERI